MLTEANTGKCHSFNSLHWHYSNSCCCPNHWHPWKWACWDRWSIGHPWKWYHLAGIGVFWRLFRCSFAFANSNFAAAIFVNNSLNFLSTSAVLLLHETTPLNALVRSDVAFMTSVLGVTYGFMIYWCLKNIVSLILVALVFTM